MVQPFPLQFIKELTICDDGGKHIDIKELQTYDYDSDIEKEEEKETAKVFDLTSHNLQENKQKMTQIEWAQMSLLYGLEYSRKILDI